MPTFWNTWTNPNPEVLAEIIAYNRWTALQGKMPKSWKRIYPTNWNSDTLVQWTTLGIPAQASNYAVAKAKTEIMVEAQLLETSFRAWTGKSNFSKELALPGTDANVVIWQAPFACTVTNVRGYRVGGIGATINARKNGTSDHLASDLSLTSADSWMDGGAVQNAAYAAGDSLELMIVSVDGPPTQITIQVDFTRP